ncbi:hypothetical protein [Cyanobium sp. NIES-981]|uniref:hypothetical protein n=1 Tax=Cyanobium sp. NIES-981 TaxID=1851505 RepID=UPI0007DDB4D5|nr:hypothetical protein [Cyanobium sp. NIES-981]SBO42424.1 conserved protein of unknown function [Cyanobium sp. NIES-981]
MERRAGLAPRGRRGGDLTTHWNGSSGRQHHMEGARIQGHGAPLASAQGVAYSTRHNRPVAGRDWGFWYFQTSKKVWFPVQRGGVQELIPVFTYDGRPILHHSERRSSWTRSHPAYAGRTPVSWGHFLGTDFSNGPGGTQLYLKLWTRWTWLHPEACGHPERFRVDFFAAVPNSASAGEVPAMMDPL